MQNVTAEKVCSLHSAHTRRQAALGAKFCLPGFWSPEPPQVTLFVGLQSIPEWVLKITVLYLLLFIAAHWLGGLNWLVVKLFDFPEESWVGQAKLQNQSAGIQYSWSLFKSLYQMIGGENFLKSGIGMSCAADDVRGWCQLESWMSIVQNSVLLKTQAALPWPGG